MHNGDGQTGVCAQVEGEFMVGVIMAMGCLSRSMMSGMLHTTVMHPPPIT